ncbi:hypothetical protein Q6346_12040 [Isoptericola sp. b490]|uniref:hypothetical protein n=1 Tax=Actinotalea lenta TaxID=3064654 RepID=UPI0027122A5B|nr:hypothetical protein [Isoptericola sp. b490]MDO8122041.1 hypothetical protein [Isoptericola sp. b490]
MTRPDRATGRAALGHLVVDLPGAVPGWVVRLLPAVAVLVCGAALPADPFAWVVLPLIALVAALRPGGTVPVLLAGILAAALLFGGPVGYPVLAGLVLGVHVVAAGCAFTRHVAWGAVVDPAALRRVLVAQVPTQLVAQAFALVAAGLAGVTPAAGGGPLSLALRAVALGSLGWLVLAIPRRGR